MLQRAFFMFVFAISTLCIACNSGDKTPSPKAVPGIKKLDPSGRQNVSPKDRCPVCAMTVSKHPKFSSAITLSDDTTYYFCGTGCMIKSWLHPEVYLGVEKPKLKNAFTKNYFDGTPLNALEARWVAGSDVVGPMGPALVPLKNDADLTTFKKRHGGKHVFSLKSLTDTQFRTITGKSPAPKK